jgi:hypothetical protein
MATPRHTKHQKCIEIWYCTLSNSYTDLKSIIKLHVSSLWQIHWDFHDTSKLYSIQNNVNKPWNITRKREDKVIISRLRIGHSKLTHSYLLNKELQPECMSCSCPLSICNILLECCDFTPMRNRLFDNIQSTRDLYSNTDWSYYLFYQFSILTSSE